MNDKKKIKEVLVEFNDFAYSDNPDMTQLVRQVKRILEK